MSEREFELYLSVLSRLLRLSPAQRAEIADELRDDLESRFQDLCQQGHDRETAIQLAIEELGDASGLANHFTTIARKRRRRLIMSYSLTTVVVLAGVFLGLHAFAPDAPDLDGPKTAQAQFGGGGLGGGGIWHASGGYSNDPNAESMIMGARLFGTKPRRTTIPEKITIVASENSDYPAGLNKNIKVNFDDDALPKALQTIAEKTGVPIFIDHKSLKKGRGVSANDILVPKLGSQTSWDAGDGLTGWQILNTICRLDESQSIGWHVRNGTVWVRGKWSLWDQQNMQRTSYDLDRLLDTGMDIGTVIHLVQTLSGGQWEDIDGDGGSITPFENTLTIKTTSQVHQRIGTILQAIALHAALNPPKQTRTPAIAANQKLEAALENVASFQFEEASLEDALKKIEEEFGIACRIDHVALQDEGLSPDDFKISFDVKQQPLRVALGWMLEPMELAIHIADGNVWITTRDDYLENGLGVVFYNVREIFSFPEDSSELLNTVRTVVDGLWVDVDGEGGNVTYMYPGTLIVRQSREAHRQIAELLEFYRRSKRKPEPKVIADEEAFELRAYTPKTYDPESLAKVIPNLVTPETWNENGGDGSIQTIKPGSENFALSGNALIIRQTRSVHLKISDFLRGMGEGRQGYGGGLGGFGGGGFGSGGLGGGGFGGGGQFQIRESDGG